MGATCQCGEWPIEEYGETCPSCMLGAIAEATRLGREAKALDDAGRYDEALRFAKAAEETVERLANTFPRFALDITDAYMQAIES